MEIFKILTTGTARRTTNQNRLHLNNQYGHVNTNQLEIISNYYFFINKPKGLPHFLQFTWDLNVNSPVLNGKKKNALQEHGQSEKGTQREFAR